MLFKALNQGNDSVNCFVFILDLLLLGVQKQKWHLRKVMGLWLGSLARSNLMVPRSLYFPRFQEVRFDHVKKRKEKLFNSDKPSGQSPIGSQFSCFPYSVEDSTMQYSNSTLSRSCD